MSINEHIEFLLGTLGEPEGRKRWLQYKVKQRDMDLCGADFSNKDLRAYDLSDLEMKGAIFFGAELSGTDFSDARLSRADFRRAAMSKCCLDRADLTWANLQGVNLADACIEDATLVDARLQGADLVGADLANSDLTRCDLRSAILRYTKLTGAKLEGANVAEADLTGSVIDDEAPVTMRNFDLAIIDDRKYRLIRSRTQRAVDSDSPATEETPEQIRRTAPPRAEGGEGNLTDTPPETALGPDASKRRNEETQVDDFADTHWPKARAGERTSEESASGSGQEAAAPSPPSEEPPQAVPRAGDWMFVEELEQTPPPEPKPAPVDEPDLSETTRGRKKAKVYQGVHFTFGRKAAAKKDHSKTEKPAGEVKEAPAPTPPDKGPPREDRLQGALYVAHASDLASDAGCARILGVKERASYVEITKAYRAKAKIFHPDKVIHMTKEEQLLAREQFHFVKRAYETLTRQRDGSYANIRWVEGIVRRKSPYEHTLNELVQLVEANPGNEILLFNLGNKYVEGGNLDLAMATYERVLRINPNNDDAQHNLKSVKVQKAFGFSRSR